MPNGAPDANEWQKVAAQTLPKITKSGVNSIMYGHNVYVEPELVSASHLIRLVYATASNKFESNQLIMISPPPGQNVETKM